MKKLINVASASAGFLKMLFRAKAKVATHSENGHEVLEGWDYSPEERIIALSESFSSQEKKNPRLGLYCYAGPHQGELFTLVNRLERLSSDIDATVTLTPGEGASSHASFRLLVNGSLTLSSESGTPFRLNGGEEQKAELFDYDEVELLGNRFLVLTFPTESAELRKVLTGVKGVSK